MKRLFVLALSIVMLTCGMAFAATEIKMAYTGPADEENNGLHLYAVNFKKFVEEGTKGEITVKLFPDSQLGNEEERIELMSKQGMNQPLFNLASFAGIAPVFPEIYASAVPFMFDSYKAAHYFFDEGEYWAKAKEEFQKRSSIVLLEAVEEGGFLAFTNNKKEIKSPKDFKNLKFRGMDEGQVALFEAFGASGTPIPWTEIYMALKTGVVDGQMNPAVYVKMGSLYEVQDYLTLANIQYSDQFLVANGDMWNSFSPETREIITEAAKKANALNRVAMEEQDAAYVQFLVDKGMKAYAPNPEEMDSFRNIGQPAFAKWLSDKMSKEWIDLALESAKVANEKAKE